MDKLSYSKSFLEVKWIKNQVEGHILFGLYINHHKRIWMSILYLLYFCVLSMANYSSIEQNGIIYLMELLKFHLLSLFLIIYFAFFSNFSQSVIFWLSTKITLAFMSMILCLLGFINNLRGYTNWYFFIVLGVVWLPSFEFHSVVQKYQKMLDIIRLIISGFIVFSVL